MPGLSGVSKLIEYLSGISNEDLIRLKESIIIRSGSCYEYYGLLLNQIRIRIKLHTSLITINLT